MSLTREITLWCDTEDCVEWTTLNDYESGGGKAGMARLAARGRGWQHTVADGDLCPKHAKPRKLPKERPLVARRTRGLSDEQIAQAEEATTRAMRREIGWDDQKEIP
jgi:hypothetical protein